MDSQNQGFLTTTFRVTLPALTQASTKNMRPCAPCQKSHLGIPGTIDQAQDGDVRGGTGNDGGAQLVSTASPSATANVPPLDSTNHPVSTVIPSLAPSTNTNPDVAYHAPQTPVNSPSGGNLVFGSMSSSAFAPNQTHPFSPDNGNDGQQANVDSN
ncbi:hypothetical protein BD410DRAFT_866604 [Rickenella mellea]|uniref:Uncharacterized protein n=1 Tax=Rickenella mellea TaxID=50990 RepID=A0A4Y7Q1T2_9AGAM|nr:hypothetical protein BD410DRAFT_866604 [Rickenella mellea]